MAFSPGYRRSFPGGRTIPMAFTNLVFKKFLKPQP
jgi:hypothetical protein